MAHMTLAHLLRHRKNDHLEEHFFHQYAGAKEFLFSTQFPDTSVCREYLRRATRHQHENAHAHCGV